MIEDKPWGCVPSSAGTQLNCLRQANLFFFFFFVSLEIIISFEHLCNGVLFLFFKKKKEWRSFPQSFVFCDAIPAFFFWWVLTIHYTQQQKIKRSRRKKSKWNADAAHKLKKNKNKERIWLITELILSSILKKAFFFLLFFSEYSRWQRPILQDPLAHPS